MGGKEGRMGGEGGKDEEEDKVDTRCASLANSAASPTNAARIKPDRPKARRSMEVRRAVGARGMGGRGSMGVGSEDDAKALAMLVDESMSSMSIGAAAEGMLLLWLLASWRRLRRRGGGWWG